jgi:ABC-type nickel/cobalt efflux system permease component RcnA
VNRYARVEVSGPVVRVYYVLDEAEIPTFQDRDAYEANRDAFVRERTDAIRSRLLLIVQSQPVALTPVATLFSLPKGQGGLPTLRLAIRFEGALGASVAGSSLRAAFSDGNEPDRIGWREIVVVARGDASIAESTAPGRDTSDELRHYPANLIQAPLNLRSASFTFTPGAVEATPARLTSAAIAPARAESGFSNLVTRKVTPVALVGMIGLALLFGAGHAFAPGHGKTVMAAYLVGTRGRPIDAVLLGMIVSIMHTASVLVLAAVLYQVNRSTPVDRIYPWLTVASGVILISLGATLAFSRARTLRARRRHDHAHAHDHHDVPAHAHSHSGHAHTHDLPPDVPPLSRKGLVLLASSGGLLPSPSAVLVLLGAFVTGRAALGLGLVAVFSVGLAVTLTGIGLVLVFSGRVIAKRGMRRHKLVDCLPLASAAAIAVVGTVIATQGATRL